ncbi:MAG: hypothetical protein HQL21_06080 [Candidatus Omnitrophica bacterium]|nr:hypothetical protein [Candidatus Omnitrophota bacterium]
MIWIIKFFLAFSSMAYALLVAQSLAGFSQNSVLCYGVCFGLFLFSMSLSPVLIERYLKNPSRTLWSVQLILLFVGILGISGFFLVDHWRWGHGALWVWACLIIAIIGCIAGAVSPLLVKISLEKKLIPSAAILSADYAGSFLGSVVFVFLLYSLTGIIQAVFFVAALNAMCGVMILALMKHEGKALRFHRVAQNVILLAMMGMLRFWALIESVLIKFYTG